MIRALILSALAMPLTAACQQKDACPLVLQKDVVVIHAPAGWTGYNPSIVRLTGFGMMAGPPKSMTYLVPFKSNKTKDAGMQQWLFGENDEKWLYCTYDGGGAIQIARPMPEAGTECTITYKDAKLGGISQMSAACR